MEMRGGMRGENMINSLSGKVSIEALTALQTLMNKHKAEMDTMQSNGVQPTQVEIKTTMETELLLMIRGLIRSGPSVES